MGVKQRAPATKKGTGWTPRLVARVVAMETEKVGQFQRYLGNEWRTK